jgi:hypothetical protein
MKWSPSFRTITGANLGLHGRRGVAYFENGRFISRKRRARRIRASIAGDSAGNLWISHSGQGLFHLLGGNVVEQIPWARLGRKDLALL